MGVLASSSSRACPWITALLAAACGGNNAPTSSHLTADGGIADGQAADHDVAPLADASGDEANSMGQAADGGAGEAGAPDAGTGQPGAGGGGVGGSVVRFAVWVPDAPAAGFDICIAATGSLSWMGPLLGNGIPFPRVSQYVQVPAGAYDIRVVTPGGDCMNPIASSIGLPMITSSTRMTFAMVGAVTPRGSDSPAKIAAFPDDFGAASSQAAVRFINASGAAAAVDFGTNAGAGNSYKPLATDVLFGEASGQGAGGGTDPNGYLLMAPMSAVTVHARVIDGTMDLATGTNAIWAGGSANTIALVNGGSNDMMPEIVSCRDDAPAIEGFAICALLGR